MDITVKGLRHPHRYVLDAAQTHIYMLMKKVGRPVPRMLSDQERSSDVGRVGEWVWILLCRSCEVERPAGSLSYSRARPCLNT
ncbi:hypothetical protein LEMLEM_LOCUS27661 [Lemmus lemmus]